MTVSIGVSTIKPQAGKKQVDKNYLISQADKALYMAKQQGKNRVCYLETV
jgi:PleD family two-component response regulator